MTTIYIHRIDQVQPLKLSDGTAGTLIPCKTPTGRGFTFTFLNPLHGNFWRASIMDGDVIRVASINGAEQFQIALH
ncbi:hypothetical protein [Secundilactobacillus paracollinoides]|uniref:hypothetical protein n=1 Tax=Secundilactobacillus paracollinoides TaxID=240427 RepID=UPI0006D10216|nr:hypothetical protein [Secundilactobacillus paracollinoides]KRL80786.1 hypothetical protein FC17_GL003158 [Secundilactobacillus paracollinoides DSM 15502 = JCM 11969]